MPADYNYKELELDHVDVTGILIKSQITYQVQMGN